MSECQLEYKKLPYIQASCMFTLYSYTAQFEWNHMLSLLYLFIPVHNSLCTLFQRCNSYSQLLLSSVFSNMYFN